MVWRTVQQQLQGCSGLLGVRRCSVCRNSQEGWITCNELIGGLF
jgi:hypothetical protein